MFDAVWGITYTLENKIDPPCRTQLIVLDVTNNMKQHLFNSRIFSNKSFIKFHIHCKTFLYFREFLMWKKKYVFSLVSMNSK